MGPEEYVQVEAGTRETRLRREARAVRRGRGLQHKEEGHDQPEGADVEERGAARE